MKNAFASQYKGIDERMQGRIEAFDEAWNELVPDGTRVLVVSAIVFVASVVVKYFGWFEEMTTTAIKLSFIVGCAAYFVTFWIEFNLSRCVSIMVGTGVAEKIKEGASCK